MRLIPVAKSHSTLCTRRAVRNYANPVLLGSCPLTAQVLSPREEVEGASLSGTNISEKLRSPDQRPHLSNRMQKGI